MTPPVLAHSSHGHSRAGSIHPTIATQSETSADTSLNFFKQQILIQLGISPDFSDRTEGGICHAYEVHKAYLQACKTYEEMKADKSWVGDRLTGSRPHSAFCFKILFSLPLQEVLFKVIKLSRDGGLAGK